jgi:cytochrome bd-type quinol oxidase subunit 2
MRAQDQPFPTLDGSRWSPITQELDRLIRKEPYRGLYEAARTAWACAPLSGHFFRLGLPKYAYGKRQSEVLRALSDRLSQWILHRDQVLVAVIVLLPLLATPFRGQWNRPPHIYTVPVFMLVTGVGLVMMLRASRAGAASDRAPYIWGLVVYMSAAAAVVAGIFPYFVPFTVTIAEATASRQTLVFMIFGVGVILPIIVVYNLYARGIFRGKVHDIREDY